MTARGGRGVAAAVAAAMLAAVTGCAGGPVDAGDATAQQGPVPAHPATVKGPAVHGHVVDTAGRVATGATVVVQVALSRGEQSDRNTKSVFSFGFACLDETGCSTPTSYGRVAADGNFAVAVPHGSYAPDDPLVVTVVALRGSAARVASSVRVAQHPGTDVATGTIPLPVDGPRLASSGLTGRLVMPALGQATEPLSVTMSRPSRYAAQGNQFTVQPPTQDVSSGFDERLYESSQVLLVGKQTERWRGVSVGLSASLLAAGTATPASRGGSCYVVGASGQRVNQPDCGLTDGNIDDEWAKQDDPRCSKGPCQGRFQHDHRDVYVVLRSKVRASFLVVHGCASPWCKVQLSSDGRHFGGWLTPPTGEPESTYSVHLAPGTVVRAVHLYTDTGGFFDALREVSVFS